MKKKLIHIEIVSELSQGGLSASVKGIINCFTWKLFLTWLIIVNLARINYVSTKSLSPLSQFQFAIPLNHVILPQLHSGDPVHCQLLTSKITIENTLQIRKFFIKNIGRMGSWPTCIESGAEPVIEECSPLADLNWLISSNESGKADDRGSFVVPSFWTGVELSCEVLNFWNTEIIHISRRRKKYSKTIYANVQ